MRQGSQSNIYYRVQSSDLRRRNPEANVYIYISSQRQAFYKVIYLYELPTSYFIPPRQQSRYLFVQEGI